MHDPEAIARAVRPTIFDAACHTDLVLPLVLANLASPRLWTLSEKLRARVKDFPDDGDPRGLSPFLRAAAKQIDRDFEHVHPETVSALIGDLDLASEAARLGTAEVARAVDAIARALRIRIARGLQHSDELLRMIEDGRFPAYTYGTIDIIRANRKRVARTRAPAGLTSCLDEAALFAALAMTLPGGTLHDMVLIGAPSHYTCFGRDGAGRPFWFFAKNALLSKADWDALVARDHTGSVDDAFDTRLATADRILGIEGVFDFENGTSEIVPAHLADLREAMTHFFRVLPRPLADAFARPIRFRPPSPFAALFRRFLGSATREPLLACLRAHAAIGDRETDLVAASFRALAGCDPRVYLLAARRAAFHDLALTTRDALIARLRALPRASLFDDRERIAMPDETLCFGGTDRDIALLMHVAWERLGHTPVETLVTDTDSFVCSEGSCISATTFAPAPRPAEAAIVLRWADA